MFHLLNRTDVVVEECEEFLRDNSQLGSPIESYLVQHALVVLCADVQQEIYKIISTRVDVSTDIGLNLFVSKASKKILRSVEKSELAGFIAHFGDHEKQKFNALVDDRDATIYNSAVKNRHNVAHTAGVQISFAELKEAISAAKRILACFVFSLSPGVVSR